MTPDFEQRMTPPKMCDNCKASHKLPMGLCHYVVQLGTFPPHFVPNVSPPATPRQSKIDAWSVPETENQCPEGACVEATEEKIRRGFEIPHNCEDIKFHKDMCLQSQEAETLGPFHFLKMKLPRFGRN